MVRKFAWDPEHWRFRAEEARTIADQMRKRGRLCGALPTTTTVLLRLPRSNSPIRKEELLAIDASTAALQSRTGNLMTFVGWSRDRPFTALVYGILGPTAEML